ncbi:hypothetical protein DJ568_12670 [Mucilaginibacter hurinus]|uniref:Alpha-L-rhamnosidase six-hairpin glycosidase domain-containing protein n=1 Tax=Mucilaginibacter hurinus TaxID=2201324 RepID=A0A367GPA0_9SPHI|nr:hypothetical protein [Mucilaginibacter hurinus]RCH54666.1 hypothetical protein DJ568_12670 [Mucilaginibacter hurinus]
MKKSLLLFFVACISLSGYGQQSKSITKSIPTLEEVSGIWINADTISMPPSIRNFRGQALVNRDMTSVSWFTSAPYSGGYHTGVTRINGKSPRAQLFRWYPWQALRQTSMPTYKLNTSVKMVPEKDAIMWEVTITNTTKKSQTYTIEQDLIGFISQYPQDDWPWGYPYPTLHGKTNVRSDEITNVIANIGLPVSHAKTIAAEPNNPDFDSSKVVKPVWPSDIEILKSSKYRVISSSNSRLIIGDTETGAITGFGLVDPPDNLTPHNSGGTAYWNLKLKPGEVKKIRFFMTYGSNKAYVTANLDKWLNSFKTTFADIQMLWKWRWQEMFKPNNSLFSGTFPVLETNDKAVSKVYYTGPLTALYLLNTNLPANKRVFLTGGPRWGATVTFYWDATCWSDIWALLDPVSMKEQLRGFIHIDPSKFFGQDNYTGKGVGNGYVANYWALFQLIRSYITITKDYALLDEVIDGKKVIDHLTDYSYNWKKVSIYGQPGATDDIYRLGDFGNDPWNVLECVPTYIHVIPSFNAAYVWMLRETAKFREYMGQPQIAATLNKDADEMKQRLFKLYAGNGIWHTLFPNNKKVEVRHILDNMYFGKYLSKDLSPTMRNEMVSFIEEELLTDTWMRALSLKDGAAKYSDRPDHGPLGAFDAWPSGTIDAFAQMGYTNKAFKFYKSVAPVTYEGCWSQSHELWGDNKFNRKARVRIPERGWHNRESVAGIEFSQVLLKAFIGFRPEIQGGALQPTQTFDFTGKVHHVLYGGKYYTLTYTDGKTIMTAE